MKNILTIALAVFLFTLTTQAQNVLDGIGKLKLGSSKEVLKEIGYTSEPIVVNNSNDYYSKVYKKYNGNNTYKIEPNPKEDKHIIQAIFNPNVEVIYLPKYQLSSVLLEGIMLEYLNNELYSINIDYSKELDDAWDLKYGKAKIDLKEEEKEYKDGYGRSVTKTDEDMKLTWETNDADISCSRRLHKYHNSKGEVNYSNYYQIFRKSVYIEIILQDDEYKKDWNNKLKQQKLSDLNDL